MTTTTPFDDELAVDFDAAAANVDYLLALPGCGGLYLGSVYQEFWTLTMAERIELMRVVADAAAGRVPLVAGVSSASVQDTIELVAVAESIGMDYLMIWPPIFGPRNDEGVLDFYRQVLRTTRLPTFVYSTRLPELGYFLDNVGIQILADEFDHLYGVKDGTGDLTEFLDRTDTFGDRLQIGTPFEEYWALSRAAYPTKAADFILGSSRACYMQTRTSPYLHQMTTFIRCDRHAEAFASLSRIRGLIRLQGESFARGVHPIALMKYAMSLTGHRGVAVRPPTPALSPGDQQRVQTLMAHARLLPQLRATSVTTGV
ncbi:dihydrodipicolinate synthase family protein [Amycolatopsis sp. GM8]|uniref:dihydrodipicolinate synthase family protein n=1 Tax=Amycolatopsis sp. GM8 TaxID=2896530 RepID=UPI001F2DC77D|nr:dihydrodipicolinate synthase family protein [Amycolatopsis sp. GM8]